MIPPGRRCGGIFIETEYRGNNFVEWIFLVCNIMDVRNKWFSWKRRKWNV